MCVRDISYKKSKSKEEVIKSLDLMSYDQFAISDFPVFIYMYIDLVIS